MTMRRQMTQIVKMRDYVRSMKRHKLFNAMKTTAVKVHNPTREFFFLISPPPHIASDVSVLKDDVHYLIGHSYEGMVSRAHISLFKYDDEQIHDMIRFVESKAMEFKPFNVFLKDFGVIYNGSKRTIYMDIVNKYPIRDIFEKTIKENPDFLPHIPIAKNLSSEDFLKCMPYLKELKYSNQHFLCDRITVLMRDENNWVHYRDIMFGDSQ